MVWLEAWQAVPAGVAQTQDPCSDPREGGNTRAFVAACDPRAGRSVEDRMIGHGTWAEADRRPLDRQQPLPQSARGERSLGTGAGRVSGLRVGWLVASGIQGARPAPDR